MARVAALNTASSFDYNTYHTYEEVLRILSINDVLFICLASIEEFDYCWVRNGSRFIWYRFL